MVYTQLLETPLLALMDLFCCINSLLPSGPSKHRIQYSKILDDEDALQRNTCLLLSLDTGHN
jgi:hypothetical protein